LLVPNWGLLSDYELKNLLVDYVVGYIPSMDIEIVKRVIRLAPFRGDTSMFNFIDAVKARSANMGWSHFSGMGEINLLGALHKIDKVTRPVPVLGDTHNLPAQIVQMKVDQMWDVGFTGAKVKMSVIDVGFDENNPKLMGKVDKEQSVIKPNSHGAMVTSMITAAVVEHRDASGDLNYLGGVAPGAKLQLLSVEGTTLTADCINKALDWGANIISISLAMSDRTIDELNTAIQRARDQYAFVVLAACNERKVLDALSVAGGVARRFRGTVILAGATNLDGLVSSYSNLAGVGEPPYDFFVAPSDGLYSYDLGGEVRLLEWGGTSTATPLISSQIALLWEAAAKVYDESETPPGEIRDKWIHDTVLTAMRETANSLFLFDEVNAIRRGHASGRSLAEDSASFDALTNAMSDFGSDFSAANTAEQLPLAAQNSLSQIPTVMPTV
jgi:subtilisin family serine protease